MPLVRYRASRRRCRKDGCLARPPFLQRHHRANEKLIVDVLWYRHRDDKRYQKLVERYWLFRSQDCVDLCEPHHAEIHQRYNKLIGKYVTMHGSPSSWTWRQAENLMALMRAACDDWLATETPGLRGGFRALKRERKRAAGG